MPQDELDATFFERGFDLLQALQHKGVVPEVRLRVAVRQPEYNQQPSFQLVCLLDRILQRVVVLRSLRRLHPVEDVIPVSGLFIVEVFDALVLDPPRSHRPSVLPTACPARISPAAARKRMRNYNKRSYPQKRFESRITVLSPSRRRAPCSRSLCPGPRRMVQRCSSKRRSRSPLEKQNLRALAGRGLVRPGSANQRLRWRRSNSRRASFRRRPDSAFTAGSSGGRPSHGKRKALWDSVSGGRFAL